MKDTILFADPRATRATAPVLCIAWNRPPGEPLWDEVDPATGLPAIDPGGVSVTYPCGPMLPRDEEMPCDWVARVLGHMGRESAIETAVVLWSDELPPDDPISRRLWRLDSARGRVVLSNPG